MSATGYDAVYDPSADCFVEMHDTHALPKQPQSDSKPTVEAKAPANPSEPHSTLPFAITVARNVTSRSITGQFTCAELVEKINSKPPVEKKLNGWIIYPGTYPNDAPKREHVNLESLSGVMLDFDERGGDKVKRQTFEQRCRECGVEAVLWDTYSSDDAGTTFRAFLPTAVPFDKVKCNAAQAAVANLLGASMVPLKPMPATQGFFIQAREGRKANASTLPGSRIDTLIDFTQLETTPAPAKRSNDSFETMAVRLNGWGSTRIKSELLPHLSADCSRDEWLRVAMGIMHQLGKTNEARELVREWSAMSKTKYNEGDFDTMWRSLKPDPLGKIPVTLASVIEMANKLPVVKIGRVDDVVHRSFDDVEDEAPPRLPSPFPGALSELTEAILRASHIPQADMATLAALVGLAASIPGTFHFEDGLRVNLYGATLAFTGEGKEMPVNAAIEFATSKGAIVVSPASGEGLEDGIQPGFPTVCVIREAAHLFSVLAAKNAAPHLVSLSRNLLDFYSLNGRPFTPRSKAGGKAGAALDNVTMSALLASTPEKLGEALTTGNILDGLLGRILFAFGRMDSSPNLSTSAFAIPASLTFKPINAVGGVITLADGVKAKADALGRELFNAKRKAQNSGNVIDAALLARTFEKIKRVAGTLAVWEDNIVTMPMLEWAEAFVRASDNGLKIFVRDRMHADDVRANAAKIESAIKRVMRGSVKPKLGAQIALASKGHISRTLVQGASGLNPQQFAEASKHLIQCGEIEIYWFGYTRTSGEQKAEAIRFAA